VTELTGSWICFDCAEPYKARAGTHTVHIGHCDYCKREKPVTAARDFGYPALALEGG
jgi:hypothetical protein